MKADSLVHAVKVYHDDPSVYWYKEDIIQLHSNANGSKIRQSKKVLFLLNGPLDKFIFRAMHSKMFNNGGFFSVMTNANAMSYF